MFYNIQSYCKRTEEFQRFCVRGQIGLSTHNYGSRYFAGWRRRRRRRRMKTIRNDKNAATGNNSTSKIQMRPLELHSFQIPICGSRWRQRQMATTMTLTTATNWTKGIFKLFENKVLTLFSKRKYFKEREVGSLAGESYGMMNSKNKNLAKILYPKSEDAFAKSSIKSFKV